MIGGSSVVAGQMTAEALATYLLYLDTLVDGALELGMDAWKRFSSLLWKRRIWIESK